MVCGVFVRVGLDDQVLDDRLAVFELLCQRERLLRESQRLLQPAAPGHVRACGQQAAVQQRRRWFT